MTHARFMEEIKTASVEEEVKAVFIKLLKLKPNMKYRHDLFHERMLFEFKYDCNFASLKNVAKVIAQMAYYLRRLKFGNTEENVPNYCCVIDKDEGFLFSSSELKEISFKKESEYDWDMSPSTPDPRLIEVIVHMEFVRNQYIYDLTNEHEYFAFIELINKNLNSQLELEFYERKEINESNFENVYEIWKSKFEESVRNGSKPTKYFLCDIKEGGSYYKKVDSTVTFFLEQDNVKIKKVYSKDYEHFWTLYNKIDDASVLRNILTKSDRMSDEFPRRFTGEFFTPLVFANKGLTYLDKVLGDDWLSSGKYRIWDMCCGTGNLEYYLHADELKYVYMSTIDDSDVQYLKRLFPGATVFQYDYLNDDVAFLVKQRVLGLKIKMPQKVKDDLENENIEWVLLINPPYATSQTAGNTSESKKDVSKTAIRELMHEEGFGETSRELFSQFLYRINLEFNNRKATLAMFSKIKYLNSNNDQMIRDKIIKYEYKNGFIFNSKNFQGVKADFPVGFLIWDLVKKVNLSDQDIIVDILDDFGDKTGRKQVPTTERTNFLNKWIVREKTTTIMPPVTSSYNVKNYGPDIRDRVADGFLGSLMCKGNDFANQKYVAILSMPYASAGALSITRNNYEKALIIHAMRKATKKCWTNDRDQFYIPNREMEKKHIINCIVWSLFSNSNESVSVQNISYKNNNYSIKNEFMPFQRSSIQEWCNSDVDLKLQVMSDVERYTATYLVCNKNEISSEAQDVLSIGELIYKYFYSHRNALNTVKYKAFLWDIGWWQVRSVLAEDAYFLDKKKELDNFQKILADKIFEIAYEYKILM